MKRERTKHDSSVAARLARADALCTRRGSRLTPLRRLVLKTLLAAPGSMKAYDLLDALRAAKPGVAPQTVYRALDFLTAQGLIHRLDVINAWTACNDVGGEHHDLLLICTECGRVAELNDPVLAHHLAESAAAVGYELTGTGTEVRALCDRCRAAKAPAAQAGADTSHTL